MLYMIADAKFFVGMLLVSVVGILILVKPTRRKKKTAEEPVTPPAAEATAVEEAAGNPEQTPSGQE